LDFLTGVSNRFSFEAYLDATLSDPAASRTALHFIDLDRFKEVNDRHGHPVGDKVLVEVATRLSRLVREGDRIARVGGDEFVVVQKAVPSKDAASAMGARVVEALGAPFLIDGLTIDIAASVGIVVAPDDADARRPLVAKADAALYRAKRSSRGVVVIAS
jgi:diguanylate cyclase (GGDEF)-like protein